MVEGNNIDSFWESWNASRCKTAMLIISSLVTLGFVIAEALGHPSAPLQSGFILVVGYWAGRTSKAKENQQLDAE